jgi:hypothetical protein
VTFLTEFGDLPTIRAVITDGEAVTVTVAESVKGTRHNVECNERGVCGEISRKCLVFAVDWLEPDAASTQMFRASM